MKWLIIILAGYLIGSIPVGLLAMKLTRGVDVRKYGSGNIGTINVFRVGGIGMAAAVFLLDVIKGILPVLFTRMVFPSHPLIMVLAGLAAIVGHNWSIFLKFSGGKGVATGLGAMFAFSPGAAALSLLVWIVIVLLTRYSSLGSMTAAVAAPIIMLLLKNPWQYVVYGFIVAVLIVYAHRSNIQRLLRGEELKLGSSSSTRKGPPGQGRRR